MLPGTIAAGLFPLIKLRMHEFLLSVSSSHRILKVKNRNFKIKQVLNLSTNKSWTQSPLNFQRMVCERNNGTVKGAVPPLEQQVAALDAPLGPGRATPPSQWGSDEVKFGGERRPVWTAKFRRPCMAFVETAQSDCK